MPGEIYNLAILLSLKDMASGELDRFTANAHRANSKIHQDLQAMEKEARQQTQTIAKNIGGKTKEIDRLGVKLSDIENLKNKGLQNAGKQSSAILKQIKTEANALDDLSKTYRDSGKTEAAKQAETLAKGLREEAKHLETIGTKVKQVTKLRQQGTDAAKSQAKILEQEIKDEVYSLDQLTHKLQEVKHLQSSNLDVNIKADKLRDQIKMMDAYEDRYAKLKEKMTRDAAIGGVGVAGLMLLNKGIGSAATKEDAILNLKQAYEEDAKASGRSREMQTQDIKRIMSLATDLGNQLQGSTNDYVSLFTAMNKAGIDAEVTLSGAGRAAAYLANVTGAIRNGTGEALAEDLGSYGKMFDLQGAEYMKVVQLFSALEDRFNIGSGSLVEASKYFFSTAKTGMDLRGIEGAETTAKLFAFLKRYAGREGSEAGTSLDAVLSQFIRHDEARQALKKDFGVDIQLFDSKGKFQGVENMFAQFEKLRKLSPESRMERLNAIFGEQGSRIVAAMVEKGVEGWRSITDEANKSVSVNEKINAQMETYNAKMEALTGSWENFKAAAFTPLMEDAKKFLDYGSNIVNSLEQFSSQNQGLMGTLGTLAAYGSTAMVLYGAFNTLTTGIRLFRMASAISRGEGLLPYLTETAIAANNTSAALSGSSSRVAGFTSNLGTATTKTNGLRGALGRLAGSSVVRIGVQMIGIAAAEYAVTNLVQNLTELSERLEKIKTKSDDIRQNYDRLMGLGQLYNSPGDYKGNKQEFQNQAAKILDQMSVGGSLQEIFHPERLNWFQRLFVDERSFNADNTAAHWKQAGLTMPLQDINTLAQVLVKLRQGGGDDWNLNLGQIKKMETAIEKLVGPEKMRNASDLANKELSVEKPASAKSVKDLFNFNQQTIPVFSTPLTNLNPINNASKFGGGSPLFANPFNFNPAKPWMPNADRKFTYSDLMPGGFKPTTGFDLNKPLFPANFSGEISATQKSMTDLNSSSNTLNQSFLELSKQAAQQQQNAELIAQQGQTIQTFGQSLLDLQKPIGETQNQIGTLGSTVQRVPPPLYRMISSADGASISLDNLSSKLENWQPPVPQAPSYSVNVPNGTGTPTVFPSHAVGGIVEKDGMAMLHAGNVITPAKTTKGLSGFNSLMSLAKENEFLRATRNDEAKRILSSTSTQTINLTYSPSVTVDGNDKNSKAEFQAMLNDHSKQIEHMISRIMENRRTRA